MQRDVAITTLEQLGSGQWGLVTTAQAEAVGVPRVKLSRLQKAGVLQRIRQGVYALPSAGYEPLQDLRAAWLSTSPSQTVDERLDDEQAALVSHLSAAHVHGLGDVIPTQHEFTLGRRRQTSTSDLRFHRAEVSGDDRDVVHGLLVTSVTRTVVDLADGGMDFDHLATVVRDALAHPDVKPQQLGPRLNDAARRLGFHAGEELVRQSLERVGMPAVAKNLTDWTILPPVKEETSFILDTAPLSAVLAGIADSIPKIDAQGLAAMTRTIHSLGESLRPFADIHAALMKELTEALPSRAEIERMSSAPPASLEKIRRLNSLSPGAQRVDSAVPERDLDEEKEL